MIPAGRSSLLVAWREVTERIWSRAFTFSTIGIVAVVVAGVVAPSLADGTAQVRVGITGATSPALPDALRSAARADDVRLELRRYRTRAAGESAVSAGDTGVLIVAARRLVWKSDPDARTAAVVGSALQRVLFTERAATVGLTAEQARALIAPASLPASRLEASDADREARQTIAFVSFIVLLVMVLAYGNSVAEGVAQEKGTRVMELLVCRVRPRDLLAGKVLGIGLVGLCQMLLALIAGAATIVALDTVDVPAAVPATLAAAVLWFALGYAFLSVAFAAAGALVSRVEDLSSVVTPLSWIVLICSFAAPVAADHPDAWYVHVASFFPVSAPFVMPVRTALGDVTVWESGLAAAIMIAAGYGLVRLGGAVYAGALLRTGERPRLRDLRDAARAR
jgi:ABC-2 type transport system permease protein